jgi:hypothetical protein
MVVGQLKNARVFQWLCMLHKKLKVPHIWNYFESGHGKGEHDGVVHMHQNNVTQERNEVHNYFPHSRCKIHC